MIKEESIIEKKEKTEFTPLPENMYQVELLDVTVDDNETYDSKKENRDPKEFEKQLSFQFTLLNGTDLNATKEEFKDLRGRNIWANFVPTYLYIGGKGPNKLYQIITYLIGRTLTPEEESTFTSKKINELVGMQCRILVKHKHGKDGSIFSNIDSYLAKETDVTPLTEDEKKNATVKPKGEASDEELQNPSEGTPEHPQAQPLIADREEEISVSDIPY